MTGLAVMLIGIVVSLPISLVLCSGATEVAEAAFLGFTIIAVMRWFRQSQAKRKHAANQAAQATARNLADPGR
jgi:membrane protein implicated in regulation of membrane protease activity